MSKFQPPMLNDEVCRMATDKQTHKYIHKKHTYRVKTEETFFTANFFIFNFSFSISLKVKKTVSKKTPMNHIFAWRERETYKMLITLFKHVNCSSRGKRNNTLKQHETA